MKREIRIWAYPSIPNRDYVTGGGYGVQEEKSTLNVSYRNTEVILEFTEEGICVQTFQVERSGNIESGPMEEKVFSYSKRANRRDSNMPLDASFLSVPDMCNPKVKADFRHAVVISPSKKKKPKKSRKNNGNN